MLRPTAEAATTGTEPKSAPKAPPAAVKPPLAHVLEGHNAGQGFTGVFDTVTGKVELRPSTSATPRPDGWVPRNGGHAKVSELVGGNKTDHLGFAVIIEQEGTLKITWRSGVLNPPPAGLVPSAQRSTIIQAVEQATGRKISQ